MTQITLDLTPELGRRLDGWCKEFREPPQTLAVGLLEEYFEDSDTGARIVADVDTGIMKTYPMEEVHEGAGVPVAVLGVAEDEKARLLI